MEHYDLREELFYYPYKGDNYGSRNDANIKYCSNMTPYIYTLNDDFYEQYSYPQNIKINKNESIITALELTTSDKNKLSIPCNVNDAEPYYPHPVIGDFRGKSYKLSYKNKHQVTFTNSQVYAAFAFPPGYSGSDQIGGNFIEYAK